MDKVVFYGFGNSEIAKECYIKRFFFKLQVMDPTFKVEVLHPLIPTDRVTRI